MYNKEDCIKTLESNISLH